METPRRVKKALTPGKSMLVPAIASADTPMYDHISRDRDKSRMKILGDEKLPSMAVPTASKRRSNWPTANGTNTAQALFHSSCGNVGLRPAVLTALA
jgi:hypothetical protein